MLAGETDRTTLDVLIGRASLPVATAIWKILNEREPTFEDGLALASATGADLDAMVVAADYLRRRVNGDVVTYVVNRNIQFTNICNVGCKFCAFSVGPKSREGYSLSMEEIKEKVREAAENGATEVCIQGGISPHDSPWIYRNIIRAVKEAVPTMHVHAFSPLEILTGAEKTGLSIRDYLQALKEEGLDTIPGTAAEILDDEVRRRLSPLKLRTEQWIDIVTTAHSLGIRSSSTMMYGHIEEPHHWVKHILTLRAIQKHTGGFTEFVPLGFVHENTALWRQRACRPGPTVLEDIRAHAFGRLMLHGLVNNIQVSWVKLGHKLALLCLQAGGNDYGGTLMEESISRLAGAKNGEVVWPEEIHYLVRSIGRIPAERNTTYTRIQVSEAVDGMDAIRPRRVTRRGRTVVEEPALLDPIELQPMSIS